MSDYRSMYISKVSDKPVCLGSEPAYRVNIYGKRIVRKECSSYEEALKVYDKYCKTANGRFIELESFTIRYMQQHPTPDHWHTYQEKAGFKQIFNNIPDNATGTPYRDISKMRRR